MEDVYAQGGKWAKNIVALQEVGKWGLLSIFSQEASNQISDPSMITIDGNSIFLILCVVAIIVGAGLLLKSKKK